MAKEKSYFDTLADISLELIGRLPLTAEPSPMAEIEGALSRRVEEERDSAVAEIRARAPLASDTTREARRGRSGAAGLNTVGLLSDRLTILLIKLWYMTNIYEDPEGGADLRARNIAEIIAALGTAGPGYASMNTKVTTHTIEGDAASWEEAFYGLLMINLLLWESQEVLYRADITSLPETELRGYLRFFSRGNLTRNRYIELCEHHYWA